MTRTVTYDETQWKLVPIELLTAVHNLIKCKGRFHTEQNFNILKSAHDNYLAAPPYPEDSPEHDMRNYGQSWSVKTFDNGTVKTKHIPLSDIFLPLPSAPKEPE